MTLALIKLNLHQKFLPFIRKITGAGDADLPMPVLAPAAAAAERGKERAAEKAGEGAGNGAGKQGASGSAAEGADDDGFLDTLESISVRADIRFLFCQPPLCCLAAPPPAFSVDAFLCPDNLNLPLFLTQILLSSSCVFSASRRVPCQPSL